MVKPLDVFLRDYVRVPLKEKGFSKKGRGFRLTASNGDVATVEFRARQLDRCEVEFLVEGGVHPLPWLEWKADVLRTPAGSTAAPLWQNRLLSPFTYLNSPATKTATWLFDLDEREKIDVFLDELSLMASELIALLDREALTSTVRGAAVGNHGLFVSRERSLAVLLADRGPSRELEEILQALEINEPDNNVVSWVRAKLAA